MNILFTCAGRRNYLLDYFRDALGPGGGRILAADASCTSPAIQEADEAFLLPYVNDPAYLPTLLELCQREEVTAVISLNDLELPLLAVHKRDFESIGTTVLVSDPVVVETCFDKWRTARFFSRLGIPFPATWLTLAEAREALSDGRLSFPVVVKPRWGTASIGIEFPEDSQELELAYELVRHKLKRTFLAEISAVDEARAVLIQQYLPGKEYGLDVINDLGGNYQATVVKEKLAMRAGETDKAVVVDEPALVAIGKQIAGELGHVVNLDCDFFEHEGRFYGLEMNPRFGGGYPFSHVAGLRLPQAVIHWLKGEPAPEALFTVRFNTRAAKCDRLVCIENGARNLV